jgi:acetyl esterase
MLKSLSLLAILLTGTVIISTAISAESNATAAASGATPPAGTATPPADPLAKADPDMKQVLDAQASLQPKPIETLTPAEARKQPTPADGAKIVMNQEEIKPSDAAAITTKNITIAGPAGTIPARIYIPENAGTEPLPVVVYYHGGGFVLADLDTYDSTPRAIANQAKAIVVSSHYRQAPEHKFPAAHEDAFAAYQWVLQNASSFGGDPKRVAVMGESAGGNLAINVAMMARDQGVQMPVHQVLVYPLAGVDTNTPSYVANANARPLNKAEMEWFMQQALQDDQARQDPRLNVVEKANLTGLPPTTIITAEIDPLRSEGQALGRKLENAGVAVNSEDYKGVAHEFFGMGNVVADAKDAQSVVARDLQTAFNK